MAYCTRCGAELQPNQQFCTQCGKPAHDDVVVPSSSVSDEGGFGWGLLGFCVPVAGLVLYLVWMNDKPNSAKAAGKGALISVIISFILAIIYVVAIIFLATSGQLVYV